MALSDKEYTIHKIVRSTKECAFLAVFVALLIATQFVFSALAGIELVSVLFMTYVFVMGITRGVFVATAFSLLRTMLFGFFPAVVLIYLVYYNAVAVCIGLLGKSLKQRGDVFKVLAVTSASCIATVCFTLLDDVVTPWFFHYTLEASKAYFWASIPVMIPHVVCVGVSVSLLFFPLYKIFQILLKSL